MNYRPASKPVRRNRAIRRNGIHKLLWEKRICQILCAPWPVRPPRGARLGPARCDFAAPRAEFQAASTRPPARVRRVYVAALIRAIQCGLGGFFVLPPIIKSQAERLFASQGPGSAGPLSAARGSS